jgi:hypothetical protein
MVESSKFKKLSDIREKLAAGQYGEKDLKQLRIADIDGRVVRLGDDDALAVVDRRIAAEEGASPEA